MGVRSCELKINLVILQTLPRGLDNSQSKLHDEVQKKKIMNNELATTETAPKNRIGGKYNGVDIINRLSQIQIVNKRGNMR